MNLSQYHLKEKYRKVLNNLSDEDKIKTTFKKTSNTTVINNIFTYYELKDHPLHKELALKKFNNSEYAYLYACCVIKGRWLEAEEFIKKDPECAYLYAKNVIKGRWNEAEEIIKKDPYYAYLYAFSVIKGRWHEAEKFIKTSWYWDSYKTHFNLQG